MQCLTFKAALAASVAFALSFGCITHAQTASGSNGLATRINTSAVTSNATFNRFIVRYNASTPMTAVTATQGASAAMTHAMKLQATLSSNAPTVSYKRALATGAHLIATSRKLSASEATAFMQSIASDPTVAYVQPDVMRHPIQAPASFTPNDNYFAKYQTDFLPGDGKLTPISSAANWGGANITGAWDLADGTGITIAVLDTGIVKHADLDTSLADDGYDFLTSALNSGRPGDGRAAGGWDLGDWTTGAPYSSGPDACVDAAHASGSSWHGSHVAGASGAEITNNGIGMAGMAYKAKVLPVRVLGHCGGPDSDIADAIVWASGGHVDGVPDNKHPAQVINMSLGGDGACTADDNTALHQQRCHWHECPFLRRGQWHRDRLELWCGARQHQRHRHRHESDRLQRRFRCHRREYLCRGPRCHRLGRFLHHGQRIESRMGAGFCIDVTWCGRLYFRRLQRSAGCRCLCERRSGEEWA
ncbi:hypothetical protein ABIC75_003350 [Dyella japonica]|uniref:Peptidase S8/S53 domain-containing protein n=1 Tax=Dyella japonica TaxID=231455 RepID=A0ABV2K0Q4_9GAMM